MITNFEEVTFELTDSEKKTLEYVVRYLKTTDALNFMPVSNYIISLHLRSRYKINISPARIRKIIHEIRAKGIIPNLIASSKGYYISEDLNELEAYFESLDQRINSIKEIQDQIAHVIKNLKKDVAE